MTGSANEKPRPIFIPLKTEWFEDFARGGKKTEFRKYGKRWNENVCWVGRRVILSCGYGKQRRIEAVLIGFKVGEPTQLWRTIYGSVGQMASLELEIAHE
jgi:hypothetical protein